MIERVFRKHQNTFLSDFIAGITGATAGAPQSMGFALLGGVNPIYGLYASVVPTIVGGIFVNTRMMTIAPTNVLMLMVAGMLAIYGNPSIPIPLFTFTLLVGLIQLAFGFLRLGSLTQYVSNAVITGFISGAGILIILGQLDLLTGYNVSSTSNAVRDFLTWAGRLQEINVHALIVGLVTVVTVLALYRTRLRVFAVLLAIVFASVLPAIFGWSDVLIVKNMSAIPSGFPTPIIPDLKLMPDMLSIAFATSVLASVQSAALAESIRSNADPPPDINRDLIAQGVSNIAGSFFQSLPASGSLSRTAISISAGAKTRLANILAGVFIGLLLLGAGSLIEQVALPALAGNLVVAAVGLINIKVVRMVWRVNVSARMAMIATFLSTLFLPLEFSIYVGVILSLALYIHNSADRFEIVELVRAGNGRYAEQPIPETLASNQTTILSIKGNLYFATLKKMERSLPKPTECDHPIVVLRMRNISSIGSTGINVLTRYKEQLQKCDGKLYLTGVSDELCAELERSGAIEVFTREAILPPTDVIFESMERAIADVEDLEPNSEYSEDTMEHV